MAEQAKKKAIAVADKDQQKKDVMERRGSMMNPKRKSMAGPALLSSYTAPGAMRKSFAVTSTYFRNNEKNGNLDNMLKAASQATEDINITGPIKVQVAVETTKDILCVKYTEEFDYIAAGFTDGKIRLFQTDDASCISTLTDAETDQNGTPVTCIKHRPITKNYPITNSLTCTYANGWVKCWNYNFSQCIYTIREKRQTLGITYHPRLPKFVTYGDDAKIYLYDEETRTQERILSKSDQPGKMDGHASRIFAACFNPRSNHELVTGGWDDIILFWDLRQPYALRRLQNVHMCGEGIDMNSKGTKILTAAWQKEQALKMWDYATGDLLTTIEPDVHSSLLYCGRILKDEFIACGGSDPNIFRVVNLQSNMSTAVISGLAGGITSLDIGPPPKAKAGKTSAKFDLSSLPSVVFCSGKKLYKIKFDK